MTFHLYLCRLKWIFNHNRYPKKKISYFRVLMILKGIKHQLKMKSLLSSIFLWSFLIAPEKNNSHPFWENNKTPLLLQNNQRLLMSIIVEIVLFHKFNLQNLQSLKKVTGKTVFCKILWKVKQLNFKELK